MAKRSELMKMVAVSVVLLFLISGFSVMDLGFLNPNKGIEQYEEMGSMRVSSPIGDPFVSDFSTNASTSLNLSNSQEYFFIGSTAGGRPITNESWNPDLKVYSHYSGYLSITIGHQNFGRGNFTFTGANYGIAGVGVSNFSSYVTYNASSPTNRSLNLSFATNSGDLVVILIGGVGDGYINIANGPNLNVVTNYTYSEGGADVIASGAIYYGYLSTGSYTVHISSITYPTNAGTAIGAVAYIFKPVQKPVNYLSIGIIALIAIALAIVVIALGVVFLKRRKNH